jgi:AraC family transcriptional regulator, positive regulator of tynA and feaB
MEPGAFVSEKAMQQIRDCAGEPRLSYHAWRNSLHSNYGRYSPEGIEPAAFVGWLRPLRANGLTAVDIGCNARRIERTQRDIRLDGNEHYSLLFQVAGRSAFTQNDRVARVEINDVVMIDTARPMTCAVDDGVARWLILNLPRRVLISHIGFEPQGATSRCGGTPAGRALLDLVQGADECDELSASNSYIQLAFYDLVGALFAASDQGRLSRHSDQLFARVRSFMVEHFADPDFSPSDVAARAGISLRYVQKLFADRGSSCNEYIYSLRLDHAARFISRRALLGGHKPLSEIAYECGFRDYAHFSRRFRRRFGCTPGTHSREPDQSG